MRSFLSCIAACSAAALVWPVSAASRAPSVSPQTTAAAEYAWAPSCRKCHEDIYQAWSETKHARALTRLSDLDQQRDCLGCHVTGGKRKVEKDGKTVNAGVQCESCHGAAAAHVADPSVKTGLARKPGPDSCTVCHNDRSPSFRGFFYDAMWPLSHRVKK
jgi:hypothetical protein